MCRGGVNVKKKKKSETELNEYNSEKIKKQELADVVMLTFISLISYSTRSYR